MPQEDKLAKEIIDFRDRERARQSNFRNLWQDTADMVYPQTYSIAEIRTSGQDLMSNIFDVKSTIRNIFSYKPF